MIPLDKRKDIHVYLFTCFPDLKEEPELSFFFLYCSLLIMSSESLSSHPWEEISSTSASEGRGQETK